MLLNKETKPNQLGTFLLFETYKMLYIYVSNILELHKITIQLKIGLKIALFSKLRDFDCIALIKIMLSCTLFLV